jgi:predicted dehydrogenase
LGGELVGFVAEMRGVCGPSIVLDIGVASPKRQRRCLVIGARATLELRGDSENCVFARDGAPGRLDAAEREIPALGEAPLLAELQAFLGYLEGGPPPLSDARDGLATVERLAEIEAALESGQASA